MNLRDTDRCLGLAYVDITADYYASFGSDVCDGWLDSEGSRSHMKSMLSFHCLLQIELVIMFPLCGITEGICEEQSQIGSLPDSLR